MCHWTKCCEGQKSRHHFDNSRVNMRIANIDRAFDTTDFFTFIKRPRLKYLNEYIFIWRDIKN